MFDVVLVPVYHLFLGLSSLVGPVLAIVLFTVAVRLSLLPLSIRVARTQRIRLRLAPQVDKLRTRWKNDPRRLMSEVDALYAKEGISQFAGYLPAVAQSPFFMVTYRLFTSAVIASHPNLLLAQSVLGVPLGEHLGAVFAGAGLFGTPTLVFFGLFAALVVVAVITARRIPRGAPMRGLTMAASFWPVVTAAILPLAAGVYLLVTTAWTATERAVFYPRAA